MNDGALRESTNRIVLITGASSGIGRACAEIFAKHGANLILCARRTERLKELSQQLIQRYAVATQICPLDVGDEKAVKRIIKNLPNDWQNIDILINNAGLALSLDKFQDADSGDWQIMIATNLSGLLYVTKAVIEKMLIRRSGHIINIGSVAGHDVYVGGAVYASTKHAVNALTKSLRLDLCGTGLRVTSVDPGMVDTEFSEVRFKGNKDRAQNFYKDMKPLTAEDVADAVYYCASRPPHINISELIIFPTAQAAIDVVHRQG